MGEAKRRKLRGEYPKMKKVKSKIIIGAFLENDDMPEDILGMYPDAKFMASLRKLEYQGKEFYCCIANGEFTDDDISLSTLGFATVNALISLPIKSDFIVFQEMRNGKTSFEEKMKQTLEEAPNGSRIVFFGDVDGYIDHEWVSSLENCETINVEELRK